LGNGFELIEPVAQHRIYGMLKRRVFSYFLIACGATRSDWAWAAKAALPKIFENLAMPGFSLVQEDDPANTANKTFRVGGKLPSGAENLIALRGTRRFEMRFPGGIGDAAADHRRIVSVLQHYDQQVVKLGGKRLNTGFNPADWTDVNARMHVYLLPSPDGEVMFGLWIQDGGTSHWLTLFPTVDSRVGASSTELAARITNFGHAPVYIHFDTNKAEMKPDGAPAVAQIVAVLKAMPDWKLSIEGHTDNVGRAEDNLILSKARAEAVMRAVVAQGINPVRLRASGHGQGQPVADNTSEAGRASNRRVELVKWD
jgi:OmpA-OmpF porin, OOP family